MMVSTCYLPGSESYFNFICEVERNGYKLTAQMGGFQSSYPSKIFHGRTLSEAVTAMVYHFVPHRDVSLEYRCGIIGFCLAECTGALKEKSEDK